MWSTKLQNQYFNNSRSALLYRLDSLRCYHVRTIIRFKWSKKGTPFHEKKYFPICHHKNMVLLFLFWKKRKLVLGDYFTWFWPVKTSWNDRKNAQNDLSEFQCSRTRDYLFVKERENEKFIANFNTLCPNNHFCMYWNIEKKFSIVVFSFLNLIF